MREGPPSLPGDICQLPPSCILVTPFGEALRHLADYSSELSIISLRRYHWTKIFQELIS